MRKFYLSFLFASVYSISILAQETIESYTHVSEETILQTYGLPVVRSVGGGTKFVVSYVGNWTNDMKGAFEFACKIWEEAMPTVFPIHIQAIMDESRNQAALSKVNTQSKIHDFDNETYSYPPRTGRSTWLQMKGTKFFEYIGTYDTNIYDYVLTIDMFQEPDIQITYYNRDGKITNDCSFSLDENIDSSKYDFVTLVLRDLAKSFGIMWRYNNPQMWPSVFNLETITPFELCVLQSLGSETQETMLNKATQDSLAIRNHSQTWYLYAPSSWDMHNSLSYFMPDSRKLSKLMSCNFGRGSVIRDIADNSTFNIFSDLLDWRGDIITGTGGNEGTVTESSELTTDVIDYNGNISFNLSLSNSYPLNSSDSDSNVTNPFSLDVTNDTISQIIKNFHPNFDGQNSINNYQGTVALLLNDGTWDIVYTFNPNIFDDISTSDFTLHYNNKEYARTTDGYLRCRITRCEYVPYLNRTRYNTKYYALDFLPQVVSMAKSKILPPIDEDDYYRDVEIGYKNIEGTTRIVVSQYDEGEDLPLQYALADIKSGKFIATVDREYSSTFIITSYNRNGSTTSETYVLEAITPVSNVELSFVYNDSHIQVLSNSRRMQDTILFDSYSINSLDSSVRSKGQNVFVSKQENISSNTIDVSTLPIGTYGLNLRDVFGNTHTYKFIVK